MSRESKKTGLFVVSLDFELFWGIRDKLSFEQYGENVLGVWEVIPKMLDLFAKYNIHATFATVGAMFSESLEELETFLPKEKPSYEDENLSPYHGYITASKDNDERYYFGKKIVQMVQNNSAHEIGTHTFSHYYCLEPGQTKNEFISDLKSAVQIAKSQNIELNTFIFPRHQINLDYLKEFETYGISIYRGTEKAWFHSAARGEEESVWKRAIRYIDYFVSLGNHHCQDLEEIRDGNLYRIRASRWLRPYKKSESSFDFLKIRRIKKQMEFAAKKGKIFHLWFHPHDIGIHQEQNFKMLEEILKHFKKMQDSYGMKSVNMKETVKFYNANL